MYFASEFGKLSEEATSACFDRAGLMQSNSQFDKTIKTDFAIRALLCLVLAAFSFFVSANSTDRAFRHGDDRFMQLFDSAVYLSSAQNLLSFIQKNNHTAKKQKELADMLILDGPVLPILAATAISAGKSCRLETIQSLAALNCFLQALLTATIFVLTWCLTRRKTLATAASLTWALYPPAILSTQKLNTELLCALLLTTILICFNSGLKPASMRFVRPLSFGIGGILFGLLLLNKPVLMFAVLLPLAITLLLLKRKQALTAGFTFTTMAVLALAPFWIFTQQTTGKICLLPQRVPLFNALVSNSLLTDGLQGLPQPPVPAEIARLKSIPAIELALFAQDPIAHAELDLRKISRIFAEPWNDFRRAAILPNAFAIRFAHQLICTFELAALILSIAATVTVLKNRFQNLHEDSSSIVNESQQLASLLALAAIGHTIYIAFEGIPRYGFTAAPILLIPIFWMLGMIFEDKVKWKIAIPIISVAILLPFTANFLRVQDSLIWLGSPQASGLLLEILYLFFYAVVMFALFTSSNAFSKVAKESTFKLSATAVFVCSIVVVSLSVLRETQNAELTSKFSGMTKAVRTIEITSQQVSKRPDWAMLLIDADKEISKARIAINKHQLREQPKSVFNFYQKKYDLLAFIEEFATNLKLQQEDVRQWRAVPVPVDYLNLEGANEISVSSPEGEKTTIYADFDDNDRRALPSYDIVSHSRIFVDATSREWRPKTTFLTPCKSESFLNDSEKNSDVQNSNADLSPAAGMQKGRLRLLLALGLSENESSPPINSEMKIVKLSSLSFHSSSNKAVSQFEKNQLIVDAPCSADYQISAQERATHVIVEVKGKAKADLDGQKQAVIAVRLEGKKSNGGVQDNSYFDSKGQLKPESLRLPAAMTMLNLDPGKVIEFSLKAIYPLDAVRGRGEHLTIEVMPLVEGKKLQLEDVEMTVREEAWPDLGRGKISIY